MLTYDITYYDRSGKRLPDFDTNVSEAYLESARKTLRNGESAYARCKTDPSLDRAITKDGIRPAA